jgi:acyl-CoA reductase-like NAD-dependent aldehyde dehydrogenase
VYVEEPVYDQFVSKVVEKTSTLRNERSTGPGTSDVGSMTFPPQVEIVERHVEDAKAKGAKVLVGGHRGHDGQGGYWFEPTVMVDVDHTMECMTEETFGRGGHPARQRQPLRARRVGVLQGRRAR